MSEPVISPDGKWMWTGNEWIPAPPGSTNASVSLQDSVVAGNLEVNEGDFNEPNNASLSMNDSVISGGVKITQNNTNDILLAIKLQEHDNKALEHFKKYASRKTTEWQLLHKEWKIAERNLLMDANYFGNNVEMCIVCKSAPAGANLTVEENKEFSYIFNGFNHSIMMCNWCYNTTIENYKSQAENFAKQSLHELYQKLGQQGVHDWILKNYERGLKYLEENDML